MDGIWLEDGSFQVAPGQKGKKGKGKGKKGKGKAPPGDGPEAKKARLGEPEAAEEAEANEDSDKFDFEGDWKDKQICLVNLKTAHLNGTMGRVTEYLGAEEVLENGKKRLIRRFLVALDDGKGEKSIKFENLFKVMTGSLVKLRGLDSVELNDAVAECGRLDAASMRYDVTLSDGRHIKVKPSNVDFVAKYETSQVAGDSTQTDRFRSASSLKDRLAFVEEFQYPAPNLIPAAALEEYAKKFPKSVVIGRSNAANPKGVQVLGREVLSSLRVPPGSRIIFASIPRDQCVKPALADMRHDELLRLGKFSEWVVRRCAPRPVYFLLPGIAAKGPPSLLSAATCAWPLYMLLCSDVIVLDSDRWHKSAWARLDAVLAVWARRPLYLLPEKYQAPMELPNAAGSAPASEDADDDAQNTSQSCPLSFRDEEPFTISRPTDGVPTNAGTAAAQLAKLAERASEAEGAGAVKVQRPALAVRRLG